MKIWKLKYIAFLIIWFCFNSFSIAYANGDNFKKTININNSFYTEDIYNALEQATAILDDSISLELNIINTSGNAQQLYLSIINPTIDKINIIDEKNKVVVLGDLIPFTKREFKHTNHVFPLFIDKDSSTILHIVIPTIKYKQLNVRIKLATETSFIKTTNHDNFLMAFI
ncbi:MAG TPA: 7TM-DISM domain-containing protein [Chitinophagales bacterium]|nr:7TM-DISM domain-containing protein [Chitinophagales bacterium]